MISCAYDVDCEFEAQYGCVDTMDSVESIDVLYCLHHVGALLGELEPGDSRVVFRILTGSSEPERELHMVTS